MEIASHVLKEAEELLRSGEVLDAPRQIKSAPTFYLANAKDQTIHAFGVIEFNGTIYKIGINNTR